MGDIVKEFSRRLWKQLAYISDYDCSDFNQIESLIKVNLDDLDYSLNLSKYKHVSSQNAKYHIGQYACLL